MNRVSLPAAFLAASVASAAGAADLPLAEPADMYARICNIFGGGFYYIPNTDTCLDIGGYVRAESHYVDGDVLTLRGVDPADFNNWTSRARGNIQVEARTASDLGLITTYLEFQLSVGPADTGVDYSASDMELSAAYISLANDFGTFTAGHTGSFFDFYGSDDYGTRVDIDDNTTEQTLFAVTVNGPSGLRGTLSIEDPASSGRRLGGADDHEGQELPDVVGNIRAEGDWGAAQVMGVVRRNHDDDGDGTGFAVGAGLQLKLPINNIVFSTQAGYADGALGYITTDPGALGDFGGPSADETNQAWNVRAGFLAPLTERLSAWLDGSFTHAQDDANDDSYDFWAFVLGAAYAPNAALSMGPELAYNNIDGDDAGEDGDLWGVMWRVESAF